MGQYPSVSFTGDGIGENSELVFGVAVSRSGTRVCSVSDDETVQVWDAHAGKQIGPPMKGHSRSHLHFSNTSNPTVYLNLNTEIQYAASPMLFNISSENIIWAEKRDEELKCQ